MRRFFTCLLLILILPPSCFATEFPKQNRIPVDQAGQDEDSSTGEQVDYDHPSNILKFADYLYRTGNYRRAIAEYHRYLSLENSPNRVPVLEVKVSRHNCWLKIGDCHRQMGEVESAISAFQEVVKKGNTLAEKARYQIGTTYFLATDHQRSIAAFSELAGSTWTDSLRQEKAKLWIGINQLFLHQWDQAEDLFTALSKVEDIQPSYYRTLAKQGRELPQKRPILAAALSAGAPGAGRIYVGRPADFLTTLPAVILTGWLAYDGFRQSGVRSVKGWTFGTISGIFYLSNVYGSAITTQIHNRQTVDQFLQQIVLPE